MPKLAFLTIALCCAAAACGGDPAPIPDKLPSADPEEPAVPESHTGVITDAASASGAALVAAEFTRERKAYDWSSHTGDIVFGFDSGEAATRAKKEGRIQMMYFTTPNSDASRTLARTAFKDSRVVEKSRSFVPVLVNADVEQDLTGRYSVVSMPTIVYVAPGGRELAVTIGVVNADEALVDMDAALAALPRKDDERK